MEGSPADKGVSETKKKSGGSKSGMRSPRSPKASRKQVESPKLLSQKEKKSSSKRPDGVSSPKQQDGKVHQPAIQVAQPKSPSPCTSDTFGVAETGDKVLAFQSPTSPQDILSSSKKQLCQDPETGITKAPTQAESATLVPTSIDSPAIGKSDLPDNKGKKMGSGKSDSAGNASKQDQYLSIGRTGPEEAVSTSGDLAPVTTSYGTLPIVTKEVSAIPSGSRPETRRSSDGKLLPLMPNNKVTTVNVDRDDANNVATTEAPSPTGPEKQAELPDVQLRQLKSERSVYQPEHHTRTEQPALDDAVSKAPSPIALDTLNATKDQGKGSASQMSMNKLNSVPSLSDQFSSGKEAEGTISVAKFAEKCFADQGKEAAKAPVSAEKQALVTASQPSLSPSVNSPNTFAPSNMGAGRIISQPQTWGLTARPATAALEGNKSERAVPDSSPGRNLRRLSPGSRTASRDEAMKVPNAWTVAKSLSIKVYVYFIIIMLAFVALLAFVLTRAETRVQKKNACSTKACEAYSRYLLASINTSVNPCDSFSHYVCDGWRKNHRHSVEYESLRAALGRLYSFVAGLDVPDGAQRSFKRAIVFYQSCICVVKRACDQLPSVVTALAEAGIVWPRKARSPDALRAILFTSLQLGWDTVLSFKITSLGHNKRVRVQIADKFYMLKEKRDEQLDLSEARWKQYFEVLRNRFAAAANSSAENGSLVSYEETLLVETEILETLWGSTFLTPVHAIGGKLLFDTVPTMTPERVKNTLRECGVPLHTDDTIAFDTDASSFIMQFMFHWAQHGEETMHLFISWWTVQLAALFANQPLLINFYGSQMKAELQHKVFCFSKTFLITGSEILYGYSDNFLPGTLRPAAKELVLDIRHAFRRRVLGWVSYSENATVVHNWNSTAVALKYFYEPHRGNSTGQIRTALEARVGDTDHPHNSKAMFKSDSLVANWRLAVQDIIKDPASLSLPEVIQNRDQYLLRNSGEGSPDFALMPYAFTFPYFDQGSTRELNYAGVGIRVAEALGQLFVDAYFSSENGSDLVQGFITCMEESAPEKLTRRNYARHVEPLSLSTVLDAYRSNSKAVLRDQPVVGLEWLTPVQLVFVAACFTRCTGSEYAVPAAQVQCDDTFKHVPEFSTVFQCKPGAPMNPSKKCKLI